MSEFSQLRHDLRTPVNHIIGYSELLGEELADRGVDGLDDLGKIRSAADALLEMINTRLGEGAGVSAIVGKPSEGTTVPVEPVESAPSRITGHILMVDDNASNRALLERQLARQGHKVTGAAHGREALDFLAEQTCDLVLLDVMMPVMDGFAALCEMKKSAEIRHIPVIMISALDEMESVVRCIEAGAEDYLPKPFNPTLLRARIGACLEKKALRDTERQHLRTIEETQQRLGAELAEAANYVRSILPAPVTEPFAIDWSYVPSTELGGDAFGYHWIDEDHFALYLLDVCGHGVGASLLSVSAINVIRSGALPATDARDPGAVLSALNAAFPMEDQNNMYFTLWYGVYQKSTRTLQHCSGGHPPALLLVPQADGSNSVEEIRAPGMIPGILSASDYKAGVCAIPAGASLIMLCDGTYEIRKLDGSMLEFDEFLAFMGGNGTKPDAFDRMLAWIHSLRGGSPLDDDFSLVRIRFP
ncbi:MAG: SpoIIE family protein phosphatase [Terrimicrobiaceae bacterium]|nr:SpoIIE family protein phosphatase [Terrimicrobiaceae bacterium]